MLDFIVPRPQQPMWSSRLTCFGILLAAAAVPSWAQAPTISPNGIVPLYSSSTTIQPSEWVSIYGTNLASTVAVWNGNFPTSLGSTSVTINGKSAYLWFVSPGQINLQAPDDTATGTVPVVVTTPAGTASATVTLGHFGPSFSLLDGRHVTGIILRSNGSGAYGGGSYDILGPTGTSLGYRTVAAQPGDTIALYGVGFGPTSPAVLAGQVFSGGASTTNAVQVFMNSTSVAPLFAGLVGAGLFQINLTVPPGLGTGDLPLSATVGGVQTPSGVVISLQSTVATPQVQSLILSPNSVASGGTATGTVTLSAAAPAGGALVALSSSLGVAFVPASVTVAAGAFSATFTVSAATVTSNQVSAITASYGGTSAQAALTVTPVLSFSSLGVAGNWNVVGASAISEQWRIVPDNPANGAATFTIAGSVTPTFVGCASSNGNLVFTCNNVAGVQPVLIGGAVMLVNSGSLVFTLTPASPRGIVSGTLTLLAVPLGGGAANTYTGPITGNYTLYP